MATSTRKPKSRRWNGRFLRGLASRPAKNSRLPTLQELRTKWIISSLKRSRCVQVCESRAGIQVKVFPSWILFSFLFSLVTTSPGSRISPSWNSSGKNIQTWSWTGRSFSSRRQWRNIWRREQSNRWRVKVYVGINRRVVWKLEETTFLTKTSLSPTAEG